MDSNQLIECFRAHGDHVQRKLIQELHDQRWFTAACLSIANGDYPTSVKRWAHEAIAQIPGQKNAKMTRNGLKSEAMTIRLHTLIGISSGRAMSRIDWLFDLLDDESGGIRLNALEALIALRPQSIRKDLPRMANDPKAYIRKVANAAMARNS